MNLRLFIMLLLVVCAGPAAAQDVTLNFGDDGSLATRSVQLILLITVLSVVPGLAVMVTCFPFIVTVLSILRQAIGLQQAPPNMLIVSLAMFLTWYVMDPVFTEAWTKGLQPLSEGTIELPAAFQATMAPFQSLWRTGLMLIPLPRFRPCAPVRSAPQSTRLFHC